MFDPTRPYSTLYGTGAARFFQHGRYWAGDGREVLYSEHGEEILIGEERPPAPAPEPETPKAPEREQAPPSAELAQHLEKLAAAKTFSVRKVFLDVGGPREMADGKGAKQRMLDWLAAQ